MKLADFKGPDLWRGLVRVASEKIGSAAERPGRSAAIFLDTNFTN
jgi:hypothetical protein